MSPTQRTLKVLRADGWLAGIVERFITAGPNRKFGNRSDLFGVFDIVAVNPQVSLQEHGTPSTIGVQCFSTAWREHEEKMVFHKENVVTWLEAGNGVELWGWRKLKVKRGGTAVRWTPRIKKVILLPSGYLSFVEVDW